MSTQLKLYTRYTHGVMLYALELTLLWLTVEFSWMVLVDVRLTWGFIMIAMCTTTIIQINCHTNQLSCDT